MGTGILFAALAFSMWGLFPIYFKIVAMVPAVEMIAHRVLWSLVFIVLVLAFRRQWDWIRPLRSQPRVIAGFALSGGLLALNWSVYIWAVQHDRVVDSSLGYFINPLINVLIGFLLLKERMRPGQWAAIALACSGVAWLTWHSGSFPWIGLTLALTFAFYGLLRKTASLGPLEGLALESMVLAPVCLLYLAWQGAQGHIAVAGLTPGMQLLVAVSGPLTAIPLLMFAAGARRIPLSVLGLMQYIGPSLQLAVGVLLFREPFGNDRLIGFMLIWTALTLYSLESAWRAWWNRPAAAVDK
ncbi:EamA family transporter RarD [Herminiimonas sp.]|uniref:EamA family transporter RarD n=1 Tax=Herminiimonas sp. TaxID=1926289 RepID=UPI00271E4541|nr:EamA family transporter RarD [Herminiimonas sp.]MDO8304153.1 EamA family transporter RarD [Herminiimonas sp.]